MSVTIKREIITPADAHSYLALSAGNRTLNQNYILSLAVAMESKRWDADASEIVFDASGALIDGHHRLSAILIYDAPVTMLVKRGVSKSARAIIDTGRTRTMQDLFRMFRPGESYPTNTKAALSTCVGLITHGTSAPPAIRTLDAFDAWAKLFEPSLSIIVGKVAPHRTALRNGPIIGALAFAHRKHPTTVGDFTDRLLDGVGLERGQPVHTLRHALIESRSSGAGAGHERMRISRKVLNALLSQVEGEKITKAVDGMAGLRYFSKAYDAKAVERMVKLWRAKPDEAATVDVAA